MTQLICPSRTYVSSMPLHRRILEVMREKGPYYSQQAMAKRLGISRETFRNMLNGERVIYQFELEKIAKDLKLSVDRLTQKDIEKDWMEIKRIFTDLSDNNRAADLANHFLSVAIGDTEKFDAHILYGRACFTLHQYQEAHEHRSIAHGYALKLQEKYKERDRLREAIKFLLVSYTVQKDYVQAKALIDQVHEHFAEEPLDAGVLYYSLAMIAHSAGNLEEARSSFLMSLYSVEKSNKLNEIGRAQHCVAYIEYELGNYFASKEMFEKSIATLREFDEFQLRAIKDYVKVLIALKEREQASTLILQCLNRREINSFTVLKLKFQLLHIIVNDDLEGAQLFLDNDLADTEQKIIACRMIIHYYCDRDDGHSVIRYYKILEKYTRSISEVLQDMTI